MIVFRAGKPLDMIVLDKLIVVQIHHLQSHVPFLAFSSITNVLLQGLNPHTTGAIKLEQNHNRFM